MRTGSYGFYRAPKVHAGNLAYAFASRTKNEHSCQKLFVPSHNELHLCLGTETDN